MGGQFEFFRPRPPDRTFSRPVRGFCNLRNFWQVSSIYFTSNAWGVVFVEERLQQLTERIARRINRHGLTLPAIMLLEMHKPLAGVGGALIQLVAPGVDWIFGEQNTEDLAALLGDRARVEKLIARIEELDKTRGKEVNSQC